MQSAVALSAAGQTSVRSANSCLLPVFAVNGCAVLTAEGLPKNAEGVNPIAGARGGDQGVEAHLSASSQMLSS